METRRGHQRFLLELEGACAVCGAPFRLRTRASVEKYLTRTCAQHRRRRYAFRYAHARRAEQPASERHGHRVEPEMAETAATCAMLRLLYKRSAAPGDKVEARRLALIGLRTAPLERLTVPDLRRARRLLREAIARPGA
ncbi:hypothetical protein CVT23_08940 [Minwuia thermotolerans]|uniref:Uncharacterized protein n=1 Tax=Minwuia thermotolerans TaxID=2056226 RepID=A0A2M9G2E3_9PROT|nr:hypothetical protein CVT23_08940 [Minwuia thermotolerans]